MKWSDLELVFQWSTAEWNSFVPVVEIFRKKDCGPQGCFSVNYHWSTHLVSTLEIIPLSPHWIYFSFPILFPSQWTPAHTEPSVSGHGQCNCASKQDPGYKITALLLSPPILLSLPSAQYRTESTHGFRGVKFSLTVGTREGVRFYWIDTLVYWIFLQHRGIISPEVSIYDAERFVTLFQGQALTAMRIGEHTSA